MEFLAALVGAGVVAASPFVPGLRPVAKTAVKGALAVSEVVVGTAALVTTQVSEFREEHRSQDEEAEAAEPGAEENASSEDEAAEGTSAKTAVISSVSAAMGSVANKAKDAASAASKQWNELVAEAKTKAAGEETAVMTDIPVEESATPDDLTAVKGIGPKSVALLNNAGIVTFADLAASNEEQLREILSAAGGRFKVIDPSTWPAQAQELSAA